MPVTFPSLSDRKCDGERDQAVCVIKNNLEIKFMMGHSIGNTGKSEVGKTDTGHVCLVFPPRPSRVRTTHTC